MLFRRAFFSIACRPKLDFLGVKTADSRLSSSSFIDVPPGPNDTLAVARFLDLEDPRDVIGGRMKVAGGSTEAVSLYVRTDSLESCVERLEKGPLPCSWLSNPGRESVVSSSSSCPTFRAWRLAPNDDLMVQSRVRSVYHPNSYRREKPV